MHCHTREPPSLRVVDGNGGVVDTCTATVLYVESSSFRSSALFVWLLRSNCGLQVQLKSVALTRRLFVTIFSLVLRLPSTVE